MNGLRDIPISTSRQESLIGQKLTYNSSSNIFAIYDWFESYFQKYLKSRRQLSLRSLGMNRLRDMPISTSRQESLATGHEESMNSWQMANIANISKLMFFGSLPINESETVILPAVIYSTQSLHISWLFLAKRSVEIYGVKYVELLPRNRSLLWLLFLNKFSTHSSSLQQL